MSSIPCFLQLAIAISTSSATCPRPRIFIPLAVLIIYRYTIQGLGYSGLAMFAGVAEMVARVMVGCWFVPLWGYFAACIANPVAWFFACFFLIPAYFAVRKRLTKELAAARVED